MAPGTDSRLIRQMRVELELDTTLGILLLVFAAKCLWLLCFT